MKKFFFSALIMGFVCLMATFTGCQSEESDFEPTNKIEMLKAKSKELAKKYHVNVTLNDDSIAKYADQMTVESMEEDYKMFAEMKKALQNGDGQTKTIAQNKPLSRKAFLKRRKSETETVPKPEEKPGPDDPTSGVFDGTGRSVSECCGFNIYWTICVNWEYSQGSFSTDVTLSMSCISDSDCCKEHSCAGECTSTASHSDKNVPGIRLDGKCSFSSGCIIDMSVCQYHFKVAIDYAYKNGHGSVSATL